MDLSDLQIAYPPLDEKIIPLVRALRGLGLVTMGSCHGHLEGPGHPFPWVTVFGLWNYREVYSVLKEYNDSNDRSSVLWSVDHISLQPTIQATTPEELKRLRESAEDLADFLGKNYL